MTQEQDLPGGLDFTFGGASVGSANTRTQIVSDQFFAVDSEKSYRLSVDAWAEEGEGGEINPDVRHYIGFDAYDIDFKRINPYMFYKNSGAADTRLAAPIEPGDTTITLDDASGWYDGSTSHRRTIAWLSLIHI